MFLLTDQTVNSEDYVSFKSANNFNSVNNVFFNEQNNLNSVIFSLTDQFK